MTFDLVVTAVALLGLLFVFAAIRALHRRRVLGIFFYATIAVVLFVTAGGAELMVVNLRTYRRLTAEQPAGTIAFTQLGYHEFNAAFTFTDGERADFELRGDEWQADARILKWLPLASLAGFDSVYRLDRISGRYTNIEEEQSLPHTVYALGKAQRIDPWPVLQRLQRWLPGIDAVYGSSTFLPMANGASYEIMVTQTGLLARPSGAGAAQRPR